mmetsp:Transcript_35665/g.46941  ORF Transcript_35665/g.46941 Transcript_35665/m.46941 type:complete len:80 (-) Transcript_35665:247-486(-)
MHVPESALAVRLVEPPVAIVASAVRPDLDTAAVPILALPLAQILRSVFELVFGSVFDGCIVSVSLLELHADCAPSFIAS